MFPKEKIIYIVGIGILFIAVETVLLNYFFYLPYTRKTSPGPNVCTSEAKQCPDGSYVGRTGPNCEFAECSDNGVNNP